MTLSHILKPSHMKQNWTVAALPTCVNTNYCNLHFRSRKISSIVYTACQNHLNLSLNKTHPDRLRCLMRQQTFESQLLTNLDFAACSSAGGHPQLAQHCLKAAKH